MPNFFIEDKTHKRHSNKAEYAVDLFVQGFSCSECIVMAFADQTGLQPDLAAKIASGFGFNADREKEKTCGVVTAAIIVIGLKYGPGLNRDPYVIDLCSLVTEEFLNQFLGRRKNVVCKKIHRTIKNPENNRHLTGAYAFCANITKDAAQILEEILAQDYA